MKALLEIFYQPGQLFENLPDRRGAWIAPMVAGVIVMIIITALIPIFSFEKVEGRMFAPLATTFAFALLGGLFFPLPLVPVLGSVFLIKIARKQKIYFTGLSTNKIRQPFS